MGKSCLSGFLTPTCKKCVCWNDGKDPMRPGIGCFCHFPIAQCEAYSALVRLDTAPIGAEVSTKAHGTGTILKKDMNNVEALARFEDGTLMWIASVLLAYSKERLA